MHDCGYGQDIYYQGTHAWKRANIFAQIVSTLKRLICCVRVGMFPVKHLTIAVLPNQHLCLTEEKLNRNDAGARYRHIHLSVQQPAVCLALYFWSNSLTKYSSIISAFPTHCYTAVYILDPRDLFDVTLSHFSSVASILSQSWTVYSMDSLSCRFG